MSAEPTARSFLPSPGPADWAAEDYVFASRVARAAKERGLTSTEGNSTWAMFVACSCKWGPRSAPALGCLLAIVREAWGNEVTFEFVHLSTGGCAMTLRRDSGAFWRHGAADYDDALVRALEVAPR